MSNIIKQCKLRKLYEPLLLLRALGQFHGPPIPRHRGTTTPSYQQYHRNFLDSIAYICAFEKGPDHVVAAALENGTDRPRLWLASNSDISVALEFFTQHLIDVLQHYLQTCDERGSESTESLQCISSAFGDIIVFNVNRLKTYYTTITTQLLQDSLSELSEIQKNPENQSDTLDDQARRVTRWLKDTFEVTAPLSTDQLRATVIRCHKCRNEGILRVLEEFGRASPVLSKLHVLVGKLGKHVTMTRRLFEASRHLSGLANGMDIDIVPAEPEQKLEFLATRKTEDVIKRVFNDTSDWDKYLDRLAALQKDEAGDLTPLLRRSPSTRVHAEILLMNHFETNGWTPYDPEDKYIGASKPACFLCYAYIKAHPGMYSLPASHQKLYVNWRMPDTETNRSILEELTAEVRQKLNEEIDATKSAPAWRPDSTIVPTTTPGRDLEAWLRDSPSYQAACSQLNADTASLAIDSQVSGAEQILESEQSDGWLELS